MTPFLLCQDSLPIVSRQILVEFSCILVYGLKIGRKKEVLVDIVM